MEKINAAWKVASEEMYKATEEAKGSENSGLKHLLSQIQMMLLM